MLDDVLHRLPVNLGRPPPGSAAYGLLNRHRGTFERNRFVHVPADDMVQLTGGESMEPLLAAANDLPDDPQGGGMRQRRLSYATVYAWDGTIRFDPPFRDETGEFTRYYQEPSLNADQGGRERRFAPFPKELERDPLLQRLILSHLHLIPWGAIDTRLPIRCGVHLIRLRSDGRQASVPSPNLQHCDGEPWTSIVLIDRHNVAKHSARNIVALRRCAGLHMSDIPEDDRLYEVTLAQPLETIFCDDAHVSHGVNGVLGADGQPGWRTTLLIDFSDYRVARTPAPRAQGA